MFTSVTDKHSFNISEISYIKKGQMNSDLNTTNIYVLAVINVIREVQKGFVLLIPPELILKCTFN